MSQFRNINYGKMLLEALRAYFSVNSSNQLSILYKFCAACIQPLQDPFNDYAAFRVRNALIAQCKWQIGQLTNLLNHLYDSSLSRIFITQSVVTVVSDPTFAYQWINNDQTFTDPRTISERTFADRVATSAVIINVPAGLDMADLTATIEQIRIQGIPYQIVII